MRRATTFRNKVLLAVIAIVVFTAATIQFFAQRETEKAMAAALDQNARNLLDTVVLSVENQYGSILFHESATLESRKRELRNLGTLAQHSIRGWYRLQRKGRLSRKEAQGQALAALRSMRYDGGVGYIWVNTMDRPYPRMVMHPTIPDLDGEVLDDPRFNSTLGTRENLFKAFVDICEKSGSGYVRYLWPKPTPDGLTEERPKLSYVSSFEPWGWVVGTGVYIHDIEEEKQKRVEAVIAELGKTLERVRIAGTGYLFLFNHRKEVLIHPTVKRGQDTSGMINPVTRRPLLEEFMEAATRPEHPFAYLWTRPDLGDRSLFPKRAYVRHFAPLDWYICSSYYEAEIGQPAIQLRNRVLLLAVLILGVTSLVAVVIANTLIRPLRNLTQAAGAIGREGILHAAIPVAGTTETIELGTILNGMIDSIKRSEAELRRAHSTISSVINSMPSILIGVDVEGRVTHWNNRAEEATGTPAGEAIGRPLDRAFPRLAGEMDRVREAIHSRQIHTEHRRKQPDGEVIRYEDMTIYPLVTAGVEGAVIRLDDVTDKVGLEEMMVQSEKMLSVGGLAAGMAHEINNPLAGMLQTASVMAGRLGGDMDIPANHKAAAEAGTTLQAVADFMEARGIPRMLRAICESGQRVGSIIGNMLSFARKSESRTTPCHLADLLDQALELAATDYDLKRHYDFKQVEILKVYDPRLPPVPCEGPMIQQVVLNLLRNGAQAMQDAGTPQPRFTLWTRLDGERRMACVEIEDNGPGMDEATRRRVFEPFFTTKPVGEGTGLGLSVSYFIITENHRGEMVVTSRPGQGTRFTIRLPLEEPTP